MKTILFIFLQAGFSTVANIVLKLSADSQGFWTFWLFQIGGNLAGLFGVLSYTGLLRTMPLSRAFPLTQGFSALGVLFVGSLLIFHEAFGTRHIIGILLVLSGILIIGSQRSAEAAK